MANDLLSIIPNIAATNDCESDVKTIVRTSRQIAFRAINVLLLQRNWMIGKRIYEEELKGENRAEYGAKIMATLSESLTLEFGKGFGKTNLYQFYSFYKAYPNIFHSMNGKSSLLSWTHYKFLLTVLDPKAREWYENECLSERWTVRTLLRITNRPKGGFHLLKERGAILRQLLDVIPNGIGEGSIKGEEGFDQFWVELASAVALKFTEGFFIA